jgi:hypothetical protein
MLDIPKFSLLTHSNCKHLTVPLSDIIRAFIKKVLDID